MSGRKYRVGDIIILNDTYSGGGKYANIGRIVEIFYSQYIIQIYYSGNNNTDSINCEYDCDCEECSIIDNTALDTECVDKNSEFADEQTADLFIKRILSYKMAEIIET